MSRHARGFASWFLPSICTLYLAASEGRHTWRDLRRKLDRVDDIVVPRLSRTLHLDVVLTQRTANVNALREDAQESHTHAHIDVRAKLGQCVNVRRPGGTAFLCRAPSDSAHARAPQATIRSTQHARQSCRRHTASRRTSHPVLRRRWGVAHRPDEYRWRGLRRPSGPPDRARPGPGLERRSVAMHTRRRRPHIAPQRPHGSTASGVLVWRKCAPKKVPVFTPCVSTRPMCATSPRTSSGC